MPHAWVYFATGNLFPRNRRQIATTAVRLLSGSRLAHCSIGTDSVVLDPGLRGNRYWPAWAYIEEYPTLVLAYKVRCQHPINLQAFEYAALRPKPILPTLWRYFRRGKSGWNEDCVCTVMRALATGGVKCPHRIYTPYQLSRWLYVCGCQHYHFESRQDRDPSSQFFFD